MPRTSVPYGSLRQGEEFVRAFKSQNTSSWKCEILQKLHWLACYAWICWHGYSPSNKCSSPLRHRVDMCHLLHVYELKSASHVDDRATEDIVNHSAIPIEWICYQALNPSVWRPNMINTLTTGELSLSRSRIRGCGRVQLSLVQSTFLLLQRVYPRARVIPKRINISYSFGFEAPQIRDMGWKEIFSFLFQNSNFSPFGSQKGTNIWYSPTCWKCRPNK